MKKILSLILAICLFGILPALSINEDVPHVSGDKGEMQLTVRKDTAAATAGTDGDYQPPITDATGRLWTHVGAIDSVTGTSFIDLKLIAGTNPSYYSTANANSFYWPGTTGATNTKFTVKAAAGAVKSISCSNQVNDEVGYLTLYDVAAATVTVGTTTPTLQLVCNSGSTGQAGSTTQFNFSEGGISFTTAITGAVCKTAACSDAPDVAVPILIEYK
jgi:hypothetical protein